MINTFKERMNRIANLIGSISFGILAYRYSRLIPEIHIFIFAYFLIVLGVCFLIYKSVKPGFENGVADAAIFTIIHLIRIGPELKLFLFGAYIFISISSIFRYFLPFTINFAKKFSPFSNFRIPVFSSNFPVQFSKSEIPYQGSIHT